MASDAWRAYKDGLVANGWRYIGDGFFSTVFGKEGEAHVIKVGRKPEGERHFDGWLAYAQWLAQDKPNNPHFPKVWDVQVHSDFYTAKIERLEQTDEFTCALRNTFRNQQEAARSSIKGWSDGGTLPAELAAACAELRSRFGSKYNCDLHHANVMVRVGDKPTLVMTDPLSFIVGDYARWLDNPQFDLFDWAGIPLAA